MTTPTSPDKWDNFEKLTTWQKVGVCLQMAAAAIIFIMITYKLAYPGSPTKLGAIFGTGLGEQKKEHLILYMLLFIMIFSGSLSFF